MKSHKEAKGYEAKRPVDRDSHSASEKQVRTSAAGTQSHSGAKSHKGKSGK